MAQTPNIQITDIDVDTLAGNKTNNVLEGNLTVQGIINGLNPQAISVQTTNYQMLTTDGTIIATGATNQTVTLPNYPAVGAAYVVKQGPAVTPPINVYAGLGSDGNIDGSSIYQNYTAGLANKFQFDGTTWWIID